MGVQYERAGLVGSTMCTRSGNYFDLVNPDVSTIHIEDIAWALAHTCRYGGHTLQFYSVAQHSVLVSEVVPSWCALEALLHDAAEAYVGDVIKPLKVSLPGFKEIEKRVEAAIEQRFRLFSGGDLVQRWNAYTTERAHSEIKRADLVLLKTEQRDLTAARGHSWAGLDQFTALPETIVPLGPKAAARAFLARFDQLTERRKAAA